MPQARYSRNNPTAVEVVNDAENPIQIVTPTGGVVTADPKRAATATVTPVTAAVSNTQIVASSATRLGVMVFNDSTAVMYLLYGNGTPSSSNYSTQIAPGGLFIVPDRSSRLELRAVWSAAVGKAYVTEVS